MALDGLFLNRILTELADDLDDAKINRVHQPDRHTVTLKLNSHRRGGCALLLSAHPQNARLHLTERSFDNPAQPPLFAMVLRKHIEGGRVTGVSQMGLDRVADITVEARDDIGDIRSFHLIVEIMGKHSNIILCDDTMTILAAVKPYGNGVSRYRRVLPKEPYIAPPPTGKTNPLFLTEEEFGEVLLDGDLAVTLDKAMLRSLEGISPSTAAEIVYRSNIDETLLLEEAGSYELRALYTQMKGIIEGDTAPTLCRKNGKTVDFYDQPLRRYESERIAFADLSALLDSYFGAKERENVFASKKSSLLRVVTHHRDKTAKKAEKRRAELGRAIDGEKYRLYGELLSANLYRVADHAEDVTLENFYADGEEITIPLKRELTAAENAGHYFKRYNKAKQSRNAIREHLAKNEEDLAYLETLCFETEEAADDSDLEEIRRELAQSGYLKERKGGKKRRGERPLPPIETAYLGHTIRIGRNNRQNDRLTLNSAKKDDLWLHTKDIPGSHVIISRNGGEIPEEVIVRAAGYAAYHSKARNAAKVPVDYTEVRHVKKPNGAKPGMVIYFEQTTIMAEPRKEPEEDGAASET